MERAPLGFCLMLRTPPGTPATHVRPRPGHEHGPGTTPSIFVEPPINVFFTHMRATSRRRAVRSSPRLSPPDRTGTPWAFPRASHPANQEPDDARRGGDRPSSTDLELHAQHHISRSSNRAFTHYVRPRVAPPEPAASLVRRGCCFRACCIRGSWLTLEDGRQIGAAGVLHRRTGRAAVAVSVGVAVAFRSTSNQPAPDDFSHAWRCGCGRWSAAAATAGGDDRR